VNCKTQKACSGLDIYGRLADKTVGIMVSMLKSMLNPRLCQITSPVLEQHWIVKFLVQNENSVTVHHALCINGRQLKK
jgi:hypothetical protein